MKHQCGRNIQDCIEHYSNDGVIPPSDALQGNGRGIPPGKRCCYTIARGWESLDPGGAYQNFYDRVLLRARLKFFGKRARRGRSSVGGVNAEYDLQA